jgi:NodT family efflux transporter outer membrane factor (OMF) lipoprotein
MEAVAMHDHTNPKRPLARTGAGVSCALSLLTSAAALTGCAVGPKYAPPTAPVPGEWQAQNDARITMRSGADSAWWGVFSDPTLDQLIQTAYHQNLPLETLGLRIMGARAELGIAVGQQYPQFQAAIASASAVGLSQQSVNVGVNKSFSDFGNYLIGFDATWEPDFWQKYRKGVKAEAASYFETVANYDDALVSLTAEVARTYTLIRTYEVLIDQAQENVKVQEEGLRIADARYRHGATSELDVDQATTLLESTRSTIPPLQASLEQAQNALCTLLGQPTGSLQQMLASRKGIPSVPATVAVDVPIDALRRRPDIRSVELAAVAQSERVGIAAAQLYPQITLQGTFGFQTSSGGGPGTGGNLFDASAFFYRLGGQLLYPVLNYDRIKNGVRVQDAAYEQSLVDYRQSVLKAAQEVADGMVGFLRAEDAIAPSEKAVTSAKRSVELAFAQYREGAVDFQRVLDSQRSQLQEEDALAGIHSSVATNLIALFYKALGGGWEISLGHPFVSDSVQSEMQRRTDWGNLFSLPTPEKPESTFTAAPR